MPAPRNASTEVNEQHNGLFPIRSLADATEQSSDLIADAKREHQPSHTFLLLSGGNDSMVLLDRAAREADAIVHVNTGIGIEETNEFVRAECARRKLNLIELHPPVAYDDLVLGRVPKQNGDGNYDWDGFPGNHAWAYGWLKRKAVERFLATLKVDRKQRFLLLTGLRRVESKNRKDNYTEQRRIGAQVWLNPLFHWTNEEMGEYRRAVQLPQNPVSAEMHMSGECLCGSRAHAGEREEWLFWRPEFIKGRIEPLEAECRRLGKTHCEWGGPNNVDISKPDDSIAGRLFMPMCVGCDNRFQEAS